MLSVFDLIAILLVLTAAFGWINHRFIRLPHTIALLARGLCTSLVLIGAELAFPDVVLFENVTAVIRQIDFQDAVLNGMLAFLLFAGALHVDLARLRDRAWIVGSMAGAREIVGRDHRIALSGELADADHPVTTSSGLKRAALLRSKYLPPNLQLA